MRPSYMTRMRSLSARISLSSADTSSTARPGVALGDQLVMDEFGGADIDAARRLLGDQHRRLMRQFARDDDLLQVAARQRCRPAPLVRDA